MPPKTSIWPVFSGHKAAEAAGLAPYSVLKAAAQQGCPAWRSGRWFSGEFLRWYFSRPQSADQEALNLEQEQAKLAVEKRLKLARERAVDELDLIPRSTIEAVATPIGAQLRACVMDMPDRLGPRVNPEQPQPAIAALREWRDEFLSVSHELFTAAWTTESLAGGGEESKLNPPDGE